MYTHLLISHFQFSSLDNTFEVKLFKNSSGLGFSFSREDNLIPEQINASIVRVKKLFPGQPAAESGKIDVGDVILKVNGAPLKGLSQQVSCDRWTGAVFQCSEDAPVGGLSTSCLFISAFLCHLSSHPSRKSYLLSGERLLKCPCSSADPRPACYQKLILRFR